MNVAVTAPLDRKRWLASLQSGKDVSDTLKEQMELAEEQLFKAAKPKAVYRIMKKKISGEKASPSRSIWKNVIG